VLNDENNKNNGCCGKKKWIYIIKVNGNLNIFL
jgi:hypothetical protein